MCVWFNEILSESLFTHRMMEKGSMKEENCRTIYWPMWKMFSFLGGGERKKRYRMKKKSDKKTWIALQLWGLRCTPYESKRKNQSTYNCWLLLWCVNCSLFEYRGRKCFTVIYENKYLVSTKMPSPSIHYIGVLENLFGI
jgi:hypothetical protein